MGTDETIPLRCPQCNGRMRIRPSQVADIVACPHCRGRLRVVARLVDATGASEPARPTSRRRGAPGRASADRQTTDRTAGHHHEADRPRADRESANDTTFDQETTGRGAAGRKMVGRDTADRRTMDVETASSAAQRGNAVNWGSVLYWGLLGVVWAVVLISQFIRTTPEPRPMSRSSGSAPCR